MIFYLQKIYGSKVEEIRRMISINNETKFIIDRRGDIRFVSQQEFISIPAGYKLTNV